MDTQLSQGNILPIKPQVQALLRRWMKERDILEGQINGVLQSIVIGEPGIWDLNETVSAMVRREATPKPGE